MLTHQEAMTPELLEAQVCLKSWDSFLEALE